MILQPSQSASQNLNEHFKSVGTLRHDFRNSALYAFALKHLRVGRLLDIGSGAGHFLHLASTLGHQVRGIEPDAGLLELSRSLYPKITAAIQKVSVEDLDLVEGTFDAITMLDVLEHIQEDEEVLSCVSRHLSPGGRLLVVVPQYPWLYGRRDVSIGHFRRYSRKDLHAKLLNCGLTPMWTRNWNALGLLPYLLAEKALHTPLHTSLRDQGDHGWLHSAIRYLLSKWFLIIENNLRFPWGLTLIILARAMDDPGRTLD